MSLISPKNHFLRLATRDQSRQLDEDSIQSFGIDSAILMEIAGQKAADVIRTHTGDNSNGIYVCGKGNNAGDAFVAARYLTEQAGHSVTLWLVAGDDLSPDAERNYRLLKKLAENDAPITFHDESEPVSWHDFDYAVDGMIGTGLTSELRQPMNDITDALNTSGLSTFSMDIPTGLNCDTGEILGTSVRANHTITFGTNKIGFYLQDGPSVTGILTLAELPFPNYLRRHRAVLINENLKEELQTPASSAAHKYAKGTVHIIAGSEGMTGAAIMAAKSAWNAGSGAVILYAPKGLLPVYEQTLPQIIKVPVGDKDNKWFTPNCIQPVLEKIKEKEGVVLIGPGLGLTDDTQDFIFELLQKTDQPVILDADGLSVWKKCRDIDKSRWILTPHPGELKKYIGVDSINQSDRLSKVEKISIDHQCRVLSKGYPTILATPNGQLFITGYDTRLFSRAGFGDVLAGTIAGKLAVSKATDHAITDALLSNFLSIQKFYEPQPSDIYDR